MFRNGFSFIDQVFRLYFDDDQGTGIGDVSDIAHGHSGDVAILERGADKDETGDDDGTDDGDDDASTGDKPDAKPEPETFDDTDPNADPDPEDEEEEEEEGTDKDDKDEPFEGRPTLSEVKKAYPDIFKKFPDLREVIAREYKLTEAVGTVEEAQEMALKASNFDVIETNLLSGDPSLIFKQLGENAPEALTKVVDNLLPKLMAHSQDLYLRATIPVIEQFLYTAFEHGKATNDPNLMRSAQHAAKFIFGKADIPDPNRRRGNEGPHPAEKKLEEERNSWKETRFRETSSEISSSIDTDLESEIIKGLDPDKKLSDRQRSSLIAEIKNEIDATLGKDEAFKRQMKALWKKAADADFPREQRSQIKSAFLARAKTLVPSVRTRLRAEWFGEKPPKSGGKATDKNKDQTPPKKRQITDSGRAPSGTHRRPPTPSDVDYSRTSDEDLIAGRFTRKK